MAMANSSKAVRPFHRVTRSKLGARIRHRARVQRDRVVSNGCLRLGNTSQFFTPEWTKSFPIRCLCRQRTGLVYGPLRFQNPRGPLHSSEVGVEAH